MCKFVYAVIIIKFSVPFINIISIGAGCDFVEFTWCHSKLCTVTTFIIANKTQNMCVQVSIFLSCADRQSSKFANTCRVNAVLFKYNNFLNSNTTCNFKGLSCQGQASICIIEICITDLVILVRQIHKRIWSLNILQCHGVFTEFINVVELAIDV